MKYCLLSYNVTLVDSLTCIFCAPFVVDLPDFRLIQIFAIKTDSLLLKDGPKMSSEEESVGQAVGYTRTLLCYVDANPVPSTSPTDNQLYWSRGGVVIVTDARWVTLCPVCLGLFSELFEYKVGKRVQAIPHWRKLYCARAVWLIELYTVLYFNV